MPCPRCSGFMALDLDGPTCVNCGHSEGSPIPDPFWEQIQLVKPHEGKGRRIGTAAHNAKRKSA